MRIFEEIRRRLRGTHKRRGWMLAPAYDSVTKKTSQWARSWKLDRVTTCCGSGVDHPKALATINEDAPHKLVMFIGHGAPSGLLTDPKLGKTGSLIANASHGCLLDTDDLTDVAPRLHIAAWACDTAQFFGPRIASTPGNGFLGFTGKVGLVFNDKPSEQLWSSTIKLAFERVNNNGAIASSDREWLRRTLLDARRRIASGEIDTGYYNRINSTFLKAAARLSWAKG